MPQGKRGENKNLSPHYGQRSKNNLKLQKLTLCSGGDAQVNTIKNRITSHVIIFRGGQNLMQFGNSK
jgi:hypothetical protein